MFLLNCNILYNIKKFSIENQKSLRYNKPKKKEGIILKRIRVAGIILIDGGIALMHRKDVLKRPEMPEYYTIPGGGLEEGETFEEGTKREIKEEFGIDVKVEKLLYEQESQKFNQIEKY